MLDSSRPEPINLQDFETYLEHCLNLAQSRLEGLPDLAAVEALQSDLNQYPRLESLEPPRDVFVVDRDSVTQGDRARAVETLLDGRVLLEHTCAGEATRLGLGTKYLINPPVDLTPEVMTELAEGAAYPDPQAMTSMTLGRRHMLQMAWDLSQLADQAGRDPLEVLAAQTLLIIANESTGEDLVEDFARAGFYGFQRERVYFMVQRSFHGISWDGHRACYQKGSPRRLHNHGQMLLQTTMDHQLFRVDHQGDKHYLSWEGYQALLGGFDDKISFNIEDLDYLGQSLDLEGLATALKLGGQGYRMVMEVVTNDPEDPIKGGSCNWDPELGRNVMIESFQLKGLANSDITHLNKNVNHYPQPQEALTAVRERGLAMPLVVKGGYLYFQPVQGDLNFLVRTAFVRRAQVKSLNAWKSGKNTPAALRAMVAQEARPGFLDWARRLMGLER